MDYLYKRRLDSSVIWYEKIPFLILSLLFGLVTIQSQALELGRNVNFYPLPERIVISLYTFTEYFTKTIIPVNLSYLYPFPYVVGEEMPGWLWVHAIAVPVAVILLYRHLNRWIKFGLAFFIIHILLVVNFVSLARFSIVADRYAYVSTFGLCFIIGCFTVQILSYSRWRKIFPVFIVVYFCVLAFYTFHHSEVWKNANTLKAKLRQEILDRLDYPLLKDKVKKNE